MSVRQYYEGGPPLGRGPGSRPRANPHNLCCRKSLAPACPFSQYAITRTYRLSVLEEGKSLSPDPQTIGHPINVIEPRGYEIDLENGGVIEANQA
jgi:hypothetical protein